MTLTVIDDHELDPAMVEAVEWMVLLSSGEATDADARALEEWRSRNPANERAFRVIAGVRPTARAMNAEPRVSRRSVLVASGGLASALGALALIRPPLAMWPSLAELMADHRTGPGQRYAFAPAPGVDVELNSRTSVSVLDGGQGIALIRGETFVSIDRPARFVIEAAGARIWSTLASLNVQILAGSVRIGCLSGEAFCALGAQPYRIAPLDELIVTTDGRVTRKQTPPTQLASWRRGYLVFEGALLGDVIEELNRYRSSAIVLTGDAQQRRTVSGIFYTDRIDAAVNQLQQLLGLSRRDLPGGVVLLS